MTEYRGIDVSSYQGRINWRDVKNSGRVQFAILRITEKNGIDAQFKRNVARCEARKIPWGGYKYSYALTVQKAIEEAQEVCAAVKGKHPSLPIFYDLEWATQRKLGKNAIEAIAIAFLGIVEGYGYKAGIYCNKDWYDNVLSDKLKEYDCWIASYPANDTGEVVERLRPSVGMGWQYSSKGKVFGISGNTDMDIFYKDYGAKMLKLLAEDEDDDDPLPDFTSDEPVPDFTSDDGSGKTGVTANDVLGVVRSWIGLSKPAQTHRPIIDIYNSHTPRARGYAVSYYDDYCDTTVSAVFIKLGAVDMIGGTECGVEEHVKLFKKKGIWQEDGTVTPKPGWIIVYSWKSDKQPNDTWGDHIGFVESVSNGMITTIEGNTQGGIVARNTIPAGYKYIRGYAIPQYDKATATPDFTSQPDADFTSSSAPSKERKFVGKVTASSLAVRTWAGSEYGTIKSYPLLARDDLVDVCDEINGWYYVLVAGKYYGFVNKEYVQKQ